MPVLLITCSLVVLFPCEFLVYWSLVLSSSSLLVTCMFLCDCFRIVFCLGLLCMVLSLFPSSCVCLFIGVVFWYFWGDFFVRGLILCDFLPNLPKNFGI